VFLVFAVFTLSVSAYYLCQGERSEHWKRLRDWSFSPSVRRFMCVHSNDVIAPTAQAATLAVTFPSLRKAALSSFSPFLVVGVVVVVVVAVVV